MLALPHIPTPPAIRWCISAETTLRLVKQNLVGEQVMDQWRFMMAVQTILLQREKSPLTRTLPLQWPVKCTLFSEQILIKKSTAPSLLAAAVTVVVLIHFALSDIITITEFASRRCYVTIQHKKYWVSKANYFLSGISSPWNLSNPIRWAVWKRAVYIALSSATGHYVCRFPPCAPHEGLLSCLRHG